MPCTVFNLSRYRFTRLFATGLTFFALTGRALATSPDPLHLEHALAKGSLVVIGWNHVRDSPVPRQLIDQVPSAVQAGVTALLLEVPGDYANDFAKGDFSYLLETTSGARRLRVAQAFHAAGIAVLAADIDERWLSLNPLPLRHKVPTFKTLDDRWMRMRNSHFADVAQKQLALSPASKVILLVGGAHASAVAVIARQRRIACRIIDVSQLKEGRSTTERQLEADDQEQDARAIARLVDVQLTAAAEELRSHACPWPIAAWPLEAQKHFLEWRQAAILLERPETSRAACPLEIVLRAMAKDSRLAAMLPPHDVAGWIPLGSGNGDQAFLRRDTDGLWTEKVTSPKRVLFERRFKTNGETLCPEAH